MTDLFPKTEEEGPDLARRAVLWAMSAVSLAAAGGGSTAEAAEPLPTGRITDFDFLRGRWKVRHRAFIGKRWQQFEGMVSSRSLVGGQANIDDYVWTWNGQTFRGLAVRVFDRATSRWSIFWLDGRAPERFGPPAVGGFSHVAGTFYGDEESGGKPVRARLRWLAESPDLARWEQAYSFDQERTWVPNWTMEFHRLAPDRAEPGAR